MTKVKHEIRISDSEQMKSLLSAMKAEIEVLPPKTKEALKKLVDYPKDK